MRQKQKVKVQKTEKKTRLSGESPLSIWKKPDVYAILSFIIPFVLYAITIGYGYILDDPGVLEKNRFVRAGLQGIPDILTHSYRAGSNILGDNIYRPFSQLMFALEWEWSPENPSLNHFINILFYALSCLLLYHLLRRFLNRNSKLIVFLIVSLFAVHPIHTEVVAYIKSRDEIMSLFFILLSFVFYFKWLDGRSGYYLILTSVFFFLALISKEGAITMLLVFPIAGWYFSSSDYKKILKGTFVVLIPSVTYILVRHQILADTPNIYGISPLDNFLVNAPDPFTRIATAIWLLGKYLALLVFPHPLSNDYSFNQIPFIGLDNIWFILSALIYSIFLAIAIINFRKKNPIVFGIMFFLISISIYSNILFFIGTAFGERLMFLPSVGFCLVLVLVLEKLVHIPRFSVLRVYPEGLASEKVLILLSLVILIVLSIKTFTRLHDWKDNKSLILTDVKKCPGSSRLQLHAGNVYRDEARQTSDPKTKEKLTLLSFSYYKKAISIMPSNDEAMEQLGIAWYILGFQDSAMSCYEKVLKTNSLRTDTWNNLGSIYVDRGDYIKALEHFRKAIETNPNYADAWQNIGSVYGRKGEYDKAIPYFLKAIELNPDNTLNYKLISITYQNMGMSGEANFWLEKASRIPPSGTTQ